MYVYFLFFNEDLKFYYVYDLCILISNEGKFVFIFFLEEFKKGVCFLSWWMNVGEKIYLNGFYNCFDNVYYICFGFIYMYFGLFSGNENIVNIIGIKF